MFKSLSDAICSLFGSTTNDINKPSVGSKRKRNCDENFSSDPDLSITRIEKRRRTDSSYTTNSLFSFDTLKRSAFKMADYMKPKKKFHKEFNIHPIQPTGRWNEESVTKRNGSTHQSWINGDDQHSEIKRFPASQIPSNYKAFKEVNNEKREPTNYESVTDHKHSPFFKKKSQSCLVSKCIRLNEKEKYQRLLQLQCPQIWRNRGSVMAPPSSILTSLVAKESDAHTVSSKSSSCDTSTPSSSSLLYTPSRKMLHESISKSHVRYRDKSSTVCSIDEQAASTEFRHSIFRPNVVREVMNSLKYRENKRKSSVEISEKNFKSENVNSEPIVIIDDDDEPNNDVPAKPNQFNKGAQNQKLLESSAEKQIFQNSKYFDDKELEDKKQQRIAEHERMNRLIEEEELKIAAYREKRRAQELFLEKKLKYQMRIFDDEPSVTEEIFREESETEKEEVLPVLTDEMQQTVDYALGPGNPNEILSEAFRLQITRRDIATLKGLNWLNDEVINFYMNMLIERGETNNGKVYAFNTFFYPKIMSGGTFSG
ncbi:SUMO1 sentrin specific peptidase 1 [Bulinus truncatus]|nr:SUMO1 sentrin specific peptidase 1 [Bulinus truncatus]